MAVMINDQPIVGANGDVYTADVGTAIPTSVDTPGASWIKLGMISDDGVSWTPPAEETTDIKIWQSPYPARIVTTGLSSSMKFAMDEWDRDTIPFALGGGTFEDTANTTIYHPPAPGAAESKAIYLVVLDGGVHMGIYFPKGRVINRDDTVFKADEAALLHVEFGLQVLIDTVTGAPQEPYNLVFDTATFPPASGAVTATGAKAGAPGAWLPAGATPPANLAACTGLTAYNSDGTTASGVTPWPATNYVTRADTGAADQGKCHWDGSAWVIGVA